MSTVLPPPMRRSDRRRKIEVRIDGIYLACGVCAELKHESKFGTSENSWCGRQSRCKTCRKDQE